MLLKNKIQRTKGEKVTKSGKPVIPMTNYILITGLLSDFLVCCDAYILKQRAPGDNS